MMVLGRSRQKRLFLWLLILAVVALIIVKIASTGGSLLRIQNRHRHNLYDNIEYFPDKKPTLCAPVLDKDLEPAKPGVKYGRPVRQLKHVMYTSVPKCGSRSLIWVMWEIYGHYNSSDIKDFEYRLNASPVEKEKAFLNKLLNQAERPTFFHAHHRFLNYEEEDGPVYMSILREPVSRFISWYYFMRHGDADMNDTAALQEMLGRNSALPNETIDDCIKNKREDCTGDYYYTLNINIFCGYDTRCSKDKTFALREAKKNLDKYMVVGLMEEFEDTVRVLEKLMPTMFGGGAILYKKIMADSVNISKTKFKKTPSAETLDILKSRMKEDIEFYEYAKQKFHDLKYALKIGTTRNC